MPRIVNYLDRVRPARAYDEAELAQLQIVYERACQELAIEEADSRRRETVAALIFHVSEETHDTDKALARVLRLFRQVN